MVILKRNALFFGSGRKSRELSGDKSFLTQKVKLSVYKAPDRVKIYRPLKRRKINIHKIKIISNEFSRYAFKVSGNPIPLEKAKNWSCEEEVINWLASLDICVKRLNASKFLLKNKVCSLNYIALFANRKRVELGLSPFYLEGVTEY
ncbi:MAG: hypothetical protein LBL99_00475 [Holosporaceae bacterium]|jgi:hypothetical protein|nr:hypothetical protein [Holosporaceae bacterium]